MAIAETLGDRVVVLLLGGSELSGDLFHGFTVESDGDSPRRDTRSLGEEALELLDSVGPNGVGNPLALLRNGQALSEIAADSLPWRLVLVATDQADVRHRQGDTITIAGVVQNLVKRQFPSLDVSVARITINPADATEELVTQINHIISANVDTDAGQSVILLPGGSTPAMRVLFEQAVGLLPVKSTVMIANSDGSTGKRTALQLALRAVLVDRWKRQVSTAANRADIGALGALVEGASDLGVSKSRRRKLGALAAVLSKMVELDGDLLANSPDWLHPMLRDLQSRYQLTLELPMAVCGAAERGRRNFAAAAYFGTSIEAAPQAWMRTKKINIPMAWDTSRCSNSGRITDNRFRNEPATRAGELSLCGTIRCGACPVGDQLPEVRAATLLTRVRRSDLFQRRNRFMHAGGRAGNLDEALRSTLRQVADGEDGTDLGAPADLHEFLAAFYRELFGEPHRDPVLEVAALADEVIAEI